MTAITPEEMFYRMHPEMGNERLVTMWKCPDCGMPIQEDHICDTWRWVNFQLTEARSHCEELQNENASLHVRLAETEHLLSTCRECCDTAEAERDTAVQEYAKMQLQMWTAEYCEEEVGRQRDEARQWARRMWWEAGVWADEVDDCRESIQEWRVMRNSAQVERDEARERCEELGRLHKCEYCESELFVNKDDGSPDEVYCYACYVELETENGRLCNELARCRSRCEGLNAKCMELADDWAKAAADRDDARQQLGYTRTKVAALEDESQRRGAYGDSVTKERDEALKRGKELMQQNQAAEWWKRESVQMKAERDEARATVDALLAENTEQITEMARLHDVMTERLYERDEAREWANRRTALANTFRRWLKSVWSTNHKIALERDEARQWARKLYRDVRKWRTDAWEHEERKSSVLSQLLNIEAENSALRAQSAIDNMRMVGMADEIDGLRAQLAEAQESKDDMALDLHIAENQLADVRYTALGDASLAANRALFIRDAPFETIRAVCGAILSQRSAP